MDKISKKNKELTLDYLHYTTKERNFAFINEVMLDSSVNYTDLGKSLGGNGVRTNYEDWHSIFPEIKVKVTHSIITPETVVYRIENTTTQEGFFKSIKPTGKKILFDLIMAFRIHNGKINGFNISTNIESIVRQCADVNAINIGEILTKPILSNVGGCHFVNTIISYLKSINISLSPQQWRCLCLWVAGKTSKEIAAFLDISNRTVETHLSATKDKIKCKKKKEVVEFLIHHNLGHLVDESNDVFLCR